MADPTPDPSRHPAPGAAPGPEGPAGPGPVADETPAAPGRGAPAGPRAESGRLRRSFGVLALLGAILVLGGLIGLVYTGVATLTSMILFGWLLLIGGVVGLVHAVQSRGEGYFWLAVVVAALNIAAGVVVIRHPVESAEALTMFAALLFLTGGVFRLVGSVVVRGPQFGWTLLQGAFGLLLGVLVLAEWPGSSLYVLGTFFSLALLFDGLGLIATGVGGRRIVSLVAGEQGEPGERHGRRKHGTAATKAATRRSKK
ncbi:HdeD family acid-resistance protein [Streptomyces sp. LP05-1]|uniref:HdeD family acid-resistance protein n=1 Tax=Streptomyces pyxinae TaxID=2970734 RepID=A0ABT2CMS1_9ACTN|nr:HdeD family acid-resistance protein [Streptomyces sp. LP05-1]MCS0638011.1 HdeD family acid-resistance protein [Streptomyces sp. LP05-1]